MPIIRENKFFFLNFFLIISFLKKIHIFHYFFILTYFVLIFQVIWVLSIANFITYPFEKMCGNYLVADVIICLTSDVHYNAHILLTTKGKWLEAVVHIIEFEILNLFCPKQVQLFISICVCGKLQLWPTFAKNTFKFLF